MEKEQKSKAKQQESEDAALKLKAANEAKKANRKEVENKDKGCCAGGACEVM